MPVYIFQDWMDYKFRAGFSETDDGVLDRGFSHESALGPIRELGRIPLGTREHEGELLRCLSLYRVRRETVGLRQYEVIRPAPAVIEFINGPRLANMGYITMARPSDPTRQTTREWLERASKVGPRTGLVSRAAEHALYEDARLRSLVPKSARGGWDLNEMIGGVGRPDLQTSFSFIESTLVDGACCLIHRCTYRGAVFKFPVFGEWYEREREEKPPENVIWAGLKIMRPFIRSGRAGTTRRSTARQCEFVVLPGQLPLIGGDDNGR